jgi:hypothetical protein
MSTTIIKFRDRAFWVPRSAVEVWLQLLLHRLGERSDLPDWMQDYRQQLASALKTPCFEYLVPELGDLANDEQRKALLLNLFDEVIALASRPAGVIPKEELNTLLGESHADRYRKDVPTKIPIIVGRAFSGLLRGTFGDPVKTARTLDVTGNPRGDLTMRPR